MLYTVQTGDILSLIARRSNNTVEAIMVLSLAVANEEINFI